MNLDCTATIFTQVILFNSNIQLPSKTLLILLKNVLAAFSTIHMVRRQYGIGMETN